MPTVNSISGGKTSSYLAMNYPADYNIFSLIRIEDKKCTPRDAKLIQRISDKIGMEFVATAESDITLYAVFELEQKLGSEIIWVTGETFDQLIRRKKALPNYFMRFCTTELKMKPIFEYCQLNIAPIVDMRIGFRHDEMERADYQNTWFKTIVGKTKNGRNKWKKIEWRTLEFPLIEDKITVYPIYQWSLESGIIFPEDSNCVGCFWKHIQQLRKNWDTESLKMAWFSEKEKEMHRRFQTGMSYEKIKKIGLQTDFNFGTGPGCQAGSCHD